MSLLLSASRRSGVGLGVRGGKRCGKRCFAFSIETVIKTPKSNHATAAAAADSPPVVKSDDINSPPFGGTKFKKKLLTVALVGRQNTGKSTLFNRLTSSKQAIVSDVPGTTRDRKEGLAYAAGLPFKLIDTGGLDDRGSITRNIQHQVRLAMKDSDITLFLLDSKAGVTVLDEHFAKWIRKTLGQIGAATGNDKSSLGVDSSKVSNKNDSDYIYNKDVKIDNRKVMILANKTEGAHMSTRVIDTISDSLRLGLGDALPISATHGEGISDLASELIAAAQARGYEDGSGVDDKGSKEAIKLEERVVQLAIMGRPNVGKSTLLNAFIGEERCITGPTPGLTRDAVHVEWTYNKRLFRLVDTAGLTRIRPDRKLLEDSGWEKKNFKMQEKVGKYFDKYTLPGIELMNPEEDPSQYSYQISELALVSALNALRFAQVVLLVVESDQGKFSKLDLQLARKCLEEGRALVIAANKTDEVMLKAGISSKQYTDGVRNHCDQFMREFGEVPIVATTAIDNKGTSRLLETVLVTHDAWSKRISTWVLNRWLKDTLVVSPLKRVGGKLMHIKYITQIGSRPPAFVLFTNTEELPGAVERFLRSKMQSDFKLYGVPLRFIIRKSIGKEIDTELFNKGKKSSRGRGRGEGRPLDRAGRKNPYLIKKLREKRDLRRRKDKRVYAKSTKSNRMKYK